MTDINDLKTKLAIHLEDLHHDAQNQPTDACDAGELAATAKADAKRAKIELEEIRAITQRTVRADPSKYGIDKPTEAAIAAAVMVDMNVANAERKYIDAQETADKAMALADAFEHRKSMLTAEVKLWLNNYWGDVSVKERTMAPVVDTVQKVGFDQAQGRRRRPIEKTAPH